MRLGSPLPEKKARIEIIPLIDIMFFLLASFMLASLSMIKLQSVRGLELPTASTAKRDFTADIVNIGIDKAGDVFLEKTQVNLAELHSYLSNKAHFNTNLPVYISGDRDAKHGAIIRVLDVVRREGIQRVQFAISPAATTPAATPSK
jgi:biopolymer transport protein ExbD